MPANRASSVPLGIGPAGDDPAIDEDERQAVIAVLAQGGPHCGVGGERLGLLGEVVTFDLDALTLEPVEVSGNPREDWIDAGPQTPLEQHIGGS